MRGTRAFHRNRRAIDDNIWGIAVLIIAVVVLLYFSPALIKRLRGGAREAGGLVADFKKGRDEAVTAKR